MAQIIHTTTTDDLDPTGKTLADETVRFGLDGVNYEIDLHAQNAKALREILQRYVEKARVVRKTPRNRPTSQRLNSALCRRWLREVRGYGTDVLPDRGRIPENLKQEYAAAGCPTNW